MVQRAPVNSTISYAVFSILAWPPAASQDSRLKDKGDASNSVPAHAVASLSHRCPVQEAAGCALLECEEALFVQQAARS